MIMKKIGVLTFSKKPASVLDTLDLINPDKKIDMYEVNSSNIQSVGYDQENQKLYVKFISGAIYEYDNIPLSTWTALTTTDSKGSYLHWFIKIQEYPYRQVSDTSNIRYTYTPLSPNSGEAHPEGYIAMD